MNREHRIIETALASLTLLAEETTPDVGSHARAALREAVAPLRAALDQPATCPADVVRLEDARLLRAER